MNPADWTQPPLVEVPGDLGPILRDARFLAIGNDRTTRTLRMRFALPEGAGVEETTFTVEEATHLLQFAYLPPSTPLGEGRSPEEAVAAVGDWARQGMVASTDPLSYGTPLVVQRAFLHASEEAVTLTVEGYGENPDALVW